MPSTYVHLSGRDVDTILGVYGGGYEVEVPTFCYPSMAREITSLS